MAGPTWTFQYLFFVSISYLDARQTISIDGNQLVIGGKQSNIKNVRIWEHGAETNIFNYHHVTSHYAVQVFSGSVRDILRQLHFVSTTILIVYSKMKLDLIIQSVVTEAPKCNVEVADESRMEFSCRYYGSERVNFSRGKQIADLALNKLKTANNHAPCNILIKDKEFLICNETQDFAMVPYDKITYQGRRLYKTRWNYRCYCQATDILVIGPFQGDTICKLSDKDE